MALATVTFESILLLVHVLAVVLTFGPTFAYGIMLSTAVSANQAAVPTVIRGIRRVDDVLGLPAMAVLIVTGIWLVLHGSLPWEWSDTFVSVGLTGVVVLVAMIFAFFRPRTAEALELAERDVSAGGELSEEFEGAAKQIAIGGQVASLIFLVVLFFMVVKP